MYEGLYASVPSAVDYLTRIGLENTTIPLNEMGLDMLIQAHLSHVPFENLDVWFGKTCPSLEINDLYEKIVVRHRGGYCFELNSLFCALLKELGFDAHLVVVQIVRAKDYIPIPMHCATICRIDEKSYFCDVGYGGPAANGAVADDGEMYHGFRIIKKGMYHVLEVKREESQFEAIMIYKDVPVLPVELIPLNYYVSQEPESAFRKAPSVNLRLPEGNATIRNWEFSYRSGDTHIHRNIADQDELKSILRQYFYIRKEELE